MIMDVRDDSDLKEGCAAEMRKNDYFEGQRRQGQRTWGLIVRMRVRTQSRTVSKVLACVVVGSSH